MLLPVPKWAGRGLIALVSKPNGNPGFIAILFDNLVKCGCSKIRAVLILLQRNPKRPIIKRYCS